MTLQQMEYIVALNKYRHFVLAAESCGITQPTLSAMIQKLEEELDVTLFDRNKRSVSPTPIGLKIILQAQTVLNEAQRVKEVVADELSSMKGTLHIGIIPTIAPYIVPDFIYHFKSDFPDVTLFIDEMENKTLLQELEYGNIDIAISTTTTDSSFFQIPIYKEHFIAYLSEKCRKRKPLFSHNNFPMEHMWILKEGHCLSNEETSFCQNRAIGNHVYEAGSINTLIRIVDRNGGYTIIPELHLSFLTDKQQENILPLDDSFPTQRVVALLIKKDFIRERMVNAVGDTIKKIIPAHMIDERFNKFAIKLK